MTYKEVKTLIQTLANSLSVPFAYYHFEQKTSPPFLIFKYDDSDDLYADDVNYQKIRPLTIVFCTDEKDFAKEETIESFFTNNGMSYSKSESYIDDSEMWQINYDTEVLING